MKVIGPDGARLVVLYAPEEVRSDFGWNPGFMINHIRDRYKFQQSPNLAEKPDLSNLAFKFGELPLANNSVLIQEFSILTHGAFIDSLTTEYCELFFQDLFEWGKTIFGWRSALPSLRFRYFSTLVVEFDHQIEGLLGGLESVCAIFSAALQDQYGISEPVRAKQLTLSSDPTALPSLAVLTDITIMRRVDVPYSAERFYCTGPFKTIEFSKLLERAEKVLVENIRSK